MVQRRLIHLVLIFISTKKFCVNLTWISEVEWQFVACAVKLSDLIGKSLISNSAHPKPQTDFWFEYFWSAIQKFGQWFLSINYNENAISWWFHSEMLIISNIGVENKFSYSPIVHWNSEYFRKNRYSIESIVFSGNKASNSELRYDFAVIEFSTNFHSHVKQLHCIIQLTIAILSNRMCSIQELNWLDGEYRIIFMEFCWFSTAQNWTLSTEHNECFGLFFIVNKSGCQ